ncbi:MAG: hypothetical protein ACREQQ_02050, partial [Candidatus Binatia bacterium]
MIKASAAVAATLGAYVCCEAAYRVWRYRELVALDALSKVRVLEAPLVRFDEQIGFRYIPRTVTRHLTLDADNRVSHVNTIAVNNLGHVSPRDDAVEKPASEYRIAVVGDSFTACTFNDTPWAVTLEDLLNADRVLAEHVNRSTFKVINFGMDATGIVQWPAVFEFEIARFRPDLLVVAFVENDLWRSFKWMGGVRPRTDAPYEIVLVSDSPPVTLENPRAFLSWRLVIQPPHADDPDERRRILKDVLNAKMRAMPWLSPRFELVAALLSEAGLPAPDFLRPRLGYRPDRPPRWGDDRRFQAAVRAVEK